MFQEIRMPRRSLKDVLPKKGAVVESKADKKRATAPEPPIDSEPPRRRGRRGGHRPKLVALAIFFLMILAGGFLVSRAFATASVKIEPKVVEIPLEGKVFTVPFESVTIPPVSDYRVLLVTTGTGAPAKASGLITIYNNYSAAPQTLVATTRFEGPGGKIYRIEKAVTVPGTKTVAGKTTPGAVEARVVADKAGADYNIAPADFTIPGFKGDPRYEKFSAKSKAAMSGGSSGQGLIPREEDRTMALDSLKQTLRQRAIEQIRFQIPENYILYEGAITSEYSEKLEALPGKANQATITLTANSRALIFDRAVLNKALLAGTISAAEAEQYGVVNLESLPIRLTPEGLGGNKKEADILASGQASAKYEIKTADLAAQLTGKSKAEATEIFKQFSGIAKAEVAFHPPWISAFPKAADRINIVEAK